MCVLFQEMKAIPCCFWLFFWKSVAGKKIRVGKVLQLLAFLIMQMAGKYEFHFRLSMADNEGSKVGHKISEALKEHLKPAGDSYKFFDDAQ